MNVDYEKKAQFYIERCNLQPTVKYIEFCENLIRIYERCVSLSARREIKLRQEIIKQLKQKL